MEQVKNDIQNTAQIANNSTDTSITKNTNHKVIILAISLCICLILIIIFSITLVEKHPKEKNSNITNTTPTIKSSQDKTSKINSLPQTIDKLLLYAKQTATIHSKQKDWPILTIFSYDLNSQQSTQLFTIGSIDSFPQNMYLIKDKNQILINLQYKLELYDGKTGTIQTIYNGNNKTDFITGSAVSNDDQQLAFNVTNGMVKPGEEKDNLYLLNLNTKQITHILSQNRSSQNDRFSGWLSPYFWTPDNKAIIMNYINTQNNILGMAEIAINGSNLQNLPNLIETGQVSNDRNFYAYTQEVTTPAPWACQDSGMTSIQLYDIRNNSNTTIANDPISLFRIISWSPDNQQILYQQQKYQSGTGCSALFYDTQTFIYNVDTQQTQQVTSSEDILKSWNNFLTITTDIQPNQTNLEVNGQIIDTVPAKQQLFSIGTVN